MKTGFYNIKSLSNEELKEFFKEAIMLSYNSHVEILDIGVSYTRQITTDKSLGDMVKNCSRNYHNVCVDRSIQHKQSNYGEISYSIIGGKYFLYIFITLENLKVLTEKYKLEME